jgi:cell division protein FtsW (lipid II flippase)
MPILFSALFAWCLSIWNMYGINYVFIFEFKARDHIHFLEFLQFPSLFFVLWSVFVFLTFTSWSSTFQISRLYLPLIFASICLCVLVNPIPTMYRNARYWLLKSLVCSSISVPF